ncbi:MAG TPA: hypothetical protein VKH81_13140 [Candidatus Angelobacter sp.]|nr:hypothetical protein [Candidatus Angelobacter sp.]
MAQISQESDHLLQALQQCDYQLELWLSRSPDNVRLFAQDPVAGLQAAHLELSRDAMIELVDVLIALAHKLDLVLPESAGAA